MAMTNFTAADMPGHSKADAKTDKKAKSPKESKAETAPVETLEAEVVADAPKTEPVDDSAEEEQDAPETEAPETTNKSDAS